jgi:hypothetical protein
MACNLNKSKNKKDQNKKELFGECTVLLDALLRATWKI